MQRYRVNEFTIATDHPAAGWPIINNLGTLLGIDRHTI